MERYRRQNELPKPPWWWPFRNDPRYNQGYGNRVKAQHWLQLLGYEPEPQHRHCVNPDRNQLAIPCLQRKDLLCEHEGICAPSCHCSDYLNQQRLSQTPRQKKGRFIRRPSRAHASHQEQSDPREPCQLKPRDHHQCCGRHIHRHCSPTRLPLPPNSPPQNSQQHQHRHSHCHHHRHFPPDCTQAHQPPRPRGDPVPKSTGAPICYHDHFPYQQEPQRLEQAYEAAYRNSLAERLTTHSPSPHNQHLQLQDVRPTNFLAQHFQSMPAALEPLELLLHQRSAHQHPPRYNDNHILKQCHRPEFGEPAPNIYPARTDRRPTAMPERRASYVRERSPFQYQH